MKIHCFIYNAFYDTKNINFTVQENTIYRLLSTFYFIVSGLVQTIKYKLVAL